MAIEIKHTCSRQEDDYLMVAAINVTNTIHVFGHFEGNEVEYIFDIPTAIKLSKTLRTEINKAKEGNNE